jgi:hypothetical protein
VAHRLRAERAAIRPGGGDDGSQNDAARLGLERCKPIDPFTELSRQEDSACGAELLARWRSNINMLPFKFREVARLRLVDKRTFREISQRLRIPLATADSRFKSAIRKLEKMLTPADVKMWRDLTAAEPEVIASHADTSCVFRREKSAVLPKKLTFRKYVASLSLEEQRIIHAAAIDKLPRCAASHGRCGPR